MTPGLTLIGRREYIDLPELGACRVEAKVDTGAFRTAVHCIECHVENDGGNRSLIATLDLDGKGPRIFRFQRFQLRTIKNSFGISEERYCVNMVLRIGHRRIRSHVSLSDRSGMKYQVLIGRKTLGRKFLVDVSRVFLLHQRPA